MTTTVFAIDDGPEPFRCIPCNFSWGEDEVDLFIDHLREAHEVGEEEIAEGVLGDEPDADITITIRVKGGHACVTEDE